MATASNPPRPSNASRELSFVIPGQRQPVGAGDAQVRGTVKESVRVGRQRGTGDLVRVTARPGEDVVVLTIANGPRLVLHPDDARELLQSQQGAATRSALGAGADEVAVPMQLQWRGPQAPATRGTTRGLLGQAVLAAFEVVTGVGKETAAKLVSAAVTRKIDGAVQAGVYPLSADPLPASLKAGGTPLKTVPQAADGGPLLVLVHGTFVDTVSTFGKLWTGHPQTVRELVARYGGRVYALDHPTLGQSPIANALTLAEAMPPGARLHLLTHSRGGLVAEVLARACGTGPFGDVERAAFGAASHAAHLADVEALMAIAQAKRLKVERLVRVACPARGTTLASARLDAYLSVLQWGLQLAAIPVAPELVDFLQEVARRRADPAELPGLEAMMPGSAVLAWLHAGEARIPGDLRVIAGDLQGDAVGSWVKTLLSDAFFWTDNDLVVQTRSMYGGMPRAPVSGAGAGPAASFLLDRGAKVSHFDYFANERTVAAMARALIDREPEAFAAIGPLSWAGKDASGTRDARAVARSRDGRGTDPAQRPAVFLLPGMLGSNLKLGGTRIWPGAASLAALHKLAWDPSTADQFEPDGPVEGSFDALVDRLADTHEVIVFAYDWRRPLEDEARRLAKAVDAALAARDGSGQPVRLLAHSSGGVLARTMRLEAPQTWKRLMAREGARVLMLGAPNAGLWTPMQVVSGDDTFGNALVAFGSLEDSVAVRQVMAAMPGFMQLQAGLTDPALGLDRATRWQALADQDLQSLCDSSTWHRLDGAGRSLHQWGVPPQAVLDQAVALRRRLDVQVPALGADAPRMLLVVGHAPFTPTGFVSDADGVAYLDTPGGGDGRVTTASAVLAGVPTWKVEAEHGRLPRVAEALDAYVELLSTGQTRRLPSLEPTTTPRSGSVRAGTQEPATSPLVRSRASRGLQPIEPPSTQADVLALPRADAASREDRAGSMALEVVVLNADLRFVHQPLLIGHYRSIRLTGAEAVIDGLVGQGMSRALNAGLYPDAIGSHQVFGNLHRHPDNPFQMPRPQAAVVVGLGAEGKLRIVDLVYGVRQAVLAYAQRLSEREDEVPAQFELAATLMGSGGTGVTPGAAARAIVQGLADANQRLREIEWPTVSRLTLVELYLERAADAWRALRLQEEATPHQLKLLGKVQFGPGAIRRSLDGSYRGSSYDFLSARHVPGSDPPCIAYTLDSKRARTEVHAQHAQGALLRDMVKRASNDANTDRQIGRTLYNLLIPVEMEALFGGTSEMVLEVEPQTAAIPWELLDTNVDAPSMDARPWALRSKLIRKLQVEQFRAQVLDASAEDNVLVIGEPQCDPAVYPPLDGARREAAAVSARLSAPDSGLDEDRLVTLNGNDDAQTIINALFARRYRVVHIAGHGHPGPRGGVVLSGPDIFLGANEVKAMRTVPELVFLNCCHLAGRDVAKTLRRDYDRAEFAANIAEALIQVGVRCVIAAGWAVEDEPAEQFATTFYASLLGGERFIDAVGAAREAAWNANTQGNTWAAYQCYGDPEWRWRRQAADPQRPPPLDDEFAGVASPTGLTIALETIATITEFEGGARDAQLDKLRFLEAEFRPLWGGMGAVAEAFGVAYAHLRDDDKAIEWLRAALEAEDGSASFKAAEQLCNALVRRAEALGEPPIGNEAAARADLDTAIAQLKSLVALHPTAERESLLGSAYKRLTMLETRAGHAKQAREALDGMVRHCLAAEAVARASDAGNLFYPARNAISAECRAAFLEGRLPQLPAERMKAVRDSLARAATQNPDFWSVVGQTELLVLQALAQGRLATSEPTIAATLRELKARVPSPLKWKSVHHEARFTLEPYAQMDLSKGAEQAAAARLLELLESLAGAATPGD